MRFICLNQSIIGVYSIFFHVLHFYFYTICNSVFFHVDKKFPQENKQYFATKKYVRNDKYDLEKLLPAEEIELPTLSSIYNM